MRLKSVDQSSLAEKAADTLRTAIINERLGVGTKLGERNTSEMLGVSRSPLREAYRILEKEGLLVRIPRKGVFVPEIDTREIEEIFEVRSLIESFGARKASKNIREKELKRFRTLIRQMEEGKRDGNPWKYCQASVKCHDFWMDLSNNNKLIDLYQYVRKFIMRIQVLSRYRGQFSEHSIAEHKDILNAFVTCDVDMVEQTVRNHIENVFERMLSLYQEAKGPPRNDRFFDKRQDFPLRITFSEAVIDRKW